MRVCGTEGSGISRTGLEFQVLKKIILRKTGQELLRTLREIEKETLARTRRSLFGTRGDAEYQLFLIPAFYR